MSEGVGLVLLFVVVLPFLPVVLSLFGLIGMGRHERSLSRREAGPRLWVSSSRTPPSGATEPQLLTANLVLSHPLALQLLIQLKKLIGGRIGFLEATLGRGRREVLLRLEDKARALGYDALYGLRFESCNLGEADQPSLSVELIAYGTAAKIEETADGRSA